MNSYLIFNFLIITVSTQVTHNISEATLHKVELIYGTPPSTGGSSTPSSIPTLTPNSIESILDITYIYGKRPTPTISPKSPCKCIPYYWCKDNGNLNTDGEGLVTIRLDDEDISSECPSYMFHCCPEASISPVQILPKSPPRRKGCGFRRPKGVAIDVNTKKDQAKFGELPWMVAVFTQDLDSYDKIIKKYKCGGALIHPKAVLTAAHCIENDLRHYIRAGEWDTQTDSEIHRHIEVAVKDAIIHEEFHFGGLHNDVAVLILEKEIPYQDHIDIICLPPQNFIVDDNTECIASGWGKKDFEKGSQYQAILKKINLPYVESERCQELLRTTRLGPYFLLNKSLVCAGGQKGEDTCEGDGGSPLVCPILGQPDRYHHIGIVAWGIDCGNEVPAAYVNVPLFRNWIDEIMKKHDLDPTEYDYSPISIKNDEPSDYR